MEYLQRWHGWCHMKLLPSRRVLCTPYSHAPCQFTQSHIRKVHACLAVTCHLHFWQNDRDLLRATAVTWGWNGYRNKSQHRKLTMEKKGFPPLLQGFEPVTFQSRVRRSNTELSPLLRVHTEGRMSLAGAWSSAVFMKVWQSEYTPASCAYSADCIVICQAGCCVSPAYPKVEPAILTTTLCS